MFLPDAHGMVAGAIHRDACDWAVRGQGADLFVVSVLKLRTHNHYRATARATWSPSSRGLIAAARKCSYQPQPKNAEAAARAELLATRN
jgi:hypothetical protein